MDTSVGKALDSILDRYSDALVLFGVCIHFRFHPTDLTLSLFAILGSFMMSYSTAKAEAMRLVAPTTGMKRETRWIVFICGSLFSALMVSDRPMMYAVGLVAVWANISGLARLIFVLRKAQEKD
jgi:phosphatidylglycerophosphate synthase